MHFQHLFNANTILWILTFAAELVLLVVLLGRERVRRFPWFTASIALVALRLLTAKLLIGRLPQLTMAEVFIVLADLSAVLTLLVLIEMARQSFAGASRRAWIAWILALALLGSAVLVVWGHWPPWKTLTAGTWMAALGLMQMFAQKMGLFSDVVTIGLGLLVVLLGRRYGAGRHSHPQQIMIGLSTASLAQIGVQVAWQVIAKNTVAHSMAEYEHVMGLRENLYSANNAIYIAVVLWWIVCMWIDEPGAKTAADELQDGTQDGAPDSAGISDNRAE